MIGCFTVLLGYALSIAGCKAIATYMDIQPGFVYKSYLPIPNSHCIRAIIGLSIFSVAKVSWEFCFDGALNFEAASHHCCECGAMLVLVEESSS